MSDSSRSATPNLVAAIRWHNDPGRAFRILVKADEAFGQPSHRPHEQEMQREIDQRRGQNRNRQRDQQQVAGKPIHRLTQRGLIDHHLDELPAAGRRPDDADRLIAGLEHHLEGSDDRGPGRQRAHIDVVVDGARKTSARQQPPLLPELDGHSPRPDAVEDLPRQRFRHHAGGRRIQNQGCGVGRRQARVKPVHPEVRH